MGIDFIDILSKLNKAALFFFLATIAFLAYEFYLFRKERSKKSALKVPQFGSAPVKNVPPVVQNAVNATPKFAPSPLKRKNNKQLIIIAVSLVTLGIVGLIAFRLNQGYQQDASVAPPAPRAADETVPSDLTGAGEATSSAQTDTTATSSAQTTETATSSATTSSSGAETAAESSDSAAMSGNETASPESLTESSTASTVTDTPTPTSTFLADTSSSSSPTDTPTATPTEDPESSTTDTATASPTGVSELPLTADNTSIPYTLFIFLAAIITFFVAFIY